MRKTELSNEALLIAVEEMSNGLIDANLGGDVIKKRIGLAGRGKRGGVRTIVVTNRGNRWFFVYGFEKNAVDNISAKAVSGLQDLAVDLLAMDETQLEAAVQKNFIEEISHG